MATPVCVRLDEEILGAVDERAAAGGQSRSDWLRDAIGQAVADLEPVEA